jgi:hypothetical protein
VTGDGSGVLAVVESNVVTDAERRSAVEVDNAGTISLALLVAEDQNRAWLRASDLAVVVCTLDGGGEREERLVERVTVTLNLGVSVAVLGTVAVEVVGRNNGDVVLAVLNIDRSSRDGQVVIRLRHVLGVVSERVGPGLVDGVSTSPQDCTSWDAVLEVLVHGVDLKAVFSEGSVVQGEVGNDGTVGLAVDVAEGCHDTTLFLEQAISSFDDSGAKSGEVAIVEVAGVLAHPELGIEAVGAAVLAGAQADEDFVHGRNWTRVKWGGNGSGSRRDGRRVASDGNGSGDGGGDAEELCDGQ